MTHASLFEQEYKDALGKPHQVKTFSGMENDTTLEV
jgi:hypothetical protein